MVEVILSYVHRHQAITSFTSPRPPPPCPLPPHIRSRGYHGHRCATDTARFLYAYFRHEFRLYRIINSTEEGNQERARVMEKLKLKSRRLGEMVESQTKREQEGDGERPRWKWHTMWSTFLSTPVTMNLPRGLRTERSFVLAPDGKG